MEGGGEEGEEEASSRRSTVAPPLAAPALALSPRLGRLLCRFPPRLSLLAALHRVETASWSRCASSPRPSTPPARSRPSLLVAAFLLLGLPSFAAVPLFLVLVVILVVVVLARRRRRDDLWRDKAAASASARPLEDRAREREEERERTSLRYCANSDATDMACLSLSRKSGDVTTTSEKCVSTANERHLRARRGG